MSLKSLFAPNELIGFDEKTPCRTRPVNVQDKHPWIQSHPDLPSKLASSQELEGIPLIFNFILFTPSSCFRDSVAFGSGSAGWLFLFQ